MLFLFVAISSALFLIYTAKTETVAVVVFFDIILFFSIIGYAMHWWQTATGTGKKGKKKKKKEKSEWLSEN